MTPRQAEALRIFREVGTKAETARRLNMDPGNLGKMLLAAEAAERARAQEPDGISAAIDKAAAHGADMVWLKSRDASIRWKRPSVEADPGALLAALEAGLANLPTAPVQVDPPSGPSDLMAVFPIADLHMGLATEAREVGEDWNNEIAKATFRRVFAKLVDRTPAAGTALLAALGDMLHANDQTGTTPRSKHHLDMARRHYSNVEDAEELMAWAIETLRAKFPRVVYRSVRGNHDEDSHIAVTRGLRGYYRQTPEVTVHHSDTPIHVQEWGCCMVVLTHLDRMPPARLSQFSAMTWPQIWGRTTYRLGLGGHLHKEMLDPQGGMIVARAPTIIPGDFHAFSSGYGSPRGLVSWTLDRNEGEFARHRVGVA